MNNIKFLIDLDAQPNNIKFESIHIFHFDIFSLRSIYNN